MLEPAFSLKATHAKTKSSARLHLQIGQQWEVGRQDGSERVFRWNIDFDPALSRQHFQLEVQSGGLEIQASKNRHPMIFEGTTSEKFQLQPGQRFLTAHTIFECILGCISEGTFDEHGPTTSELDLSLDILSVTLVCSIMLKAGATFGQVFQQLQQHQRPWIRGPLAQIEKAVMVEGLTLSKALARHSHLFGVAYQGMIELGEATNLATSFERLAGQLVQEYRQRSLKPGPQISALVAACGNAYEVLKAGHPLSKALLLASKASSTPVVAQAFADIHHQMQTRAELTECSFSPVFLPLFPALVGAHQSVGHPGLAFRDLARILEAP